MLHLLNYLPKQLAEYIKEKNKKIYIIVFKYIILYYFMMKKLNITIKLKDIIKKKFELKKKIMK